MRQGYDSTNDGLTLGPIRGPLNLNIAGPGGSECGCRVVGVPQWRAYGRRICERHATTTDMQAKKAQIGRMKDPLLQNTHGSPIRPTARIGLSQNDESLPPFAIFGDGSLCHDKTPLNLGNTARSARCAQAGCSLWRQGRPRRDRRIDDSFPIHVSTSSCV